MAIRNQAQDESPGPPRPSAPRLENAVIGEIHRMTLAPEITAQAICAMCCDTATQ
jgi:hypothetical protein